MVAWLGLLQLVRGSIRLWRPSERLRGSICACRSLCWLLAFYQVWQYEPFESPAGTWSSMLVIVSAGSAEAHLFLAYRRHRMGRPTRCGIAWTAAGRLVRLWGFVFLLAWTCGERAPNDLLDKPVPIYSELCLDGARSRAPLSVMRALGCGI